MNKPHNLLLYSWQIAVASIIVTLGITIVFWNQIPPLIPLFYSRPWGADQLTSKYLIFLIPGLILVIQLILSLTKTEDLVRKLSAIVSIVSSLMLTLGLLRIILLIS